MSSEPPKKGPLASLLEFAWAIFAICLLIWAAVWLLSQVWVWLIVIAILAAVITVMVWLHRSRRDRW